LVVEAQDISTASVRELCLDIEAQGCWICAERSSLGLHNKHVGCGASRAIMLTGRKEEVAACLGNTMYTN
jgi:hypothetical protein